MSAAGKRRAVIRRRLQGVAFLVVLAVLLGLAVAQYNKAFAAVAHVTLQADTAGNQLQADSDVKVRGVIVGYVRSVDASVKGATIHLAMDPRFLPQIPADVSARLLPKTLFGERYVSLVVPENATGRRLADGDVISQDRTRNAIELQRVIDDLLPLLQAVPPQQLAHTLSAVASALRGGGTRWGRTWSAPGSTSAGSTPCCRSCSTTSPRWPTSPTPTTRPPTTCWRCWTTCRSPTAPSPTSGSSCAARSP